MPKTSYLYAAAARAARLLGYQRWYAALLSMLLLGAGIPGVSVAGPCTIASGRPNTTPAGNTVVMPANLTIKASDPPGTIIWRSARFLTPYNCKIDTAGNILGLFAGVGNAISTAAVTVGVYADWLDTAGALGNFTPVNTHGEYATGRSDLDPNLYWQVVVLKGTQTTAANLAALPSAASLFGISENGGAIWPGSTYFRITGLNTIRLTNSTCAIRVSPGNTVSLRDGDPDLLSRDGATTGSTPFALNLSNCLSGPAGTTTAMNARAVVFFDGPNVNFLTGNLNNTASPGAANVQLQLTNDGITTIDLRGGPGEQGAAVGNVVNGAATLNYRVRYIAVGGAAGVGAVTSSVVFTIQYQ